VITSMAFSFVKVRSKEQLKTTLKAILKVLDEGGKAIVMVAVLCSCAQIVVGMFNASGLGIRISETIMLLSHGDLFLTLFFTMIVCLILGMGIPTTAAYVLASSVCAIGLMKLGIIPLSAHLFIFYFACISAITPPVCAAVYAAAAIANASWWKAGWIAVRLGLSGFIVPFMFIYGPGIILKGNLYHIVLDSITALFGVMLLSAGVMGFFKKKTTLLEQLLLLLAAGLLIKPGILTDVLGFALAAAVYLKQRFVR